MGEEKTRLVAWNHELLDAHQRLRTALRLARDEVRAGTSVSARTDLTLTCRGFCAALTRHHVGEDVALFPVLLAHHPALESPIAELRQDHRMIASLLRQFDAALASSGGPEVLSRHLDGIAAIMESHFRYEERQLLDMLATLDLDARVDDSPLL